MVPLNLLTAATCFNLDFITDLSASPSYFRKSDQFGDAARSASLSMLGAGAAGAGAAGAGAGAAATATGAGAGAAAGAPPLPPKLMPKKEPSGAAAIYRESWRGGLD